MDDATGAGGTGASRMTQTSATVDLGEPLLARDMPSADCLIHTLQAAISGCSLCFCTAVPSSKEHHTSPATPLEHMSQQRCLSRPVKAAHLYITIPGNSALICNGLCAGHTKREDDGVWGMGFKYANALPNNIHFLLLRLHNSLIVSLQMCLMFILLAHCNICHLCMLHTC